MADPLQIAVDLDHCLECCVESVQVRAPLSCDVANPTAFCPCKLSNSEGHKLISLQQYYILTC